MAQTYLAVRGTLADPVYDGAAVITRAKIVSPMLARPLPGECEHSHSAQHPVR